MSLKVWLPLNGSLENKGLDDITVTNNGATIDNNGKIGKCYSFGTGNSYIVIDSTPLKTFTEFSFACWVKIISWNTNYSTIFAAKNSTSTSWNNLIFSLLRSGGNPNLCFNISNGTSYTATNCYTGVLSLNTWYHIVCTYEEGKIKLYQDGNIVNTYNTTVIPNFDSIANLWIGKSNENTYQSNNLLNDVRIYDHALSPMEVKQISQGLILHYPLNRNGWGQENLITGTSSIEKNYTYPSSGYQDKFAPITTIIPSGNKYTLSFYAKSTVAGDKIRAHYYSPNTTTTCVSSQGITRTASDGNMDFTLTTNWKLYWVTYTQTETTAKKHIIIPRMGAIGNTQGIVSGTGTVSIKCIKFEEGDKPTPWCPNSADELYNTLGLNDNVEYDTSGYGNNGTKIGSFSYDSDTPKYNASTVFNGVDNCIRIGNWYSLFQNPFTINVWFKKDEIGSKGYETLLGGGSGFEIDTRAGNSQTLSLYLASARGTAYSPFNFTQWYMVTMVSDGTNELYYVDGILRKTIEKKNIPNNMYRIGAWSSDTSQNFKGQMSDFRIYATALSAEDIKSLYNNSAYIDNHGNVYGAVYEEV